MSSSYCGFASLAFTSHRGLASFALTLTFGITCALLSSLFVLPPLVSPWFLVSLYALAGMGAVAGAVLVGAGIYQWTPLKQACLRHCRSPLDFVLTQWREGSRGAS